ncbi:hypothetical protein AAVH_17418 [Aphelenchoides avenae]|nr:hypothetical protein AAVH_17418 [Aphelenchus avenae]
MLPTEALADVVSFFGYYELGGLKLTNKQYSTVAHKCAMAVRLFDFSDLRFSIYCSSIEVCREDEPKHRSRRVNLEITSEKYLTEFISEAFRNCIVGRLYLNGHCAHAMNALKAVANTIIVADTLELYFGTFGNVQELLGFVDIFRRVKRLNAWKFGGLTFHEKKGFEELCRRKNIAFFSYRP